MRVSLIVAISENGVIGRGGALPWRLSGDLQRFKQITMGHTVIMGRRTWESIGRPLPGRQMIVVSRQANYDAGCPDVTAVRGLDEALALAAARGESEAFVIGGAELYRAALPLADRLYVTIVQAEMEGDTYFPIRSLDEFDWNAWVIVEQQGREADSKNEFPCVFTTIQRCEPKIAAE